MLNMQLLIQYAMQFVGLPYKWGGDDPILGYDCSGFVQELLAAIGEDPAGDQTAQALYDAFKNRASSLQVEGSLLFFGKSVTQITHVAFAISPVLMIEAGGGGGSKTNTSADAAAQNAYLRVRPISNRKDLVASLRPVYKLVDPKPGILA